VIIIVSPGDISPCCSWSGAWVAVRELRARGYVAYVGERGEKAASPNDVDPAVWRECVERVIEEIRKGLGREHMNNAELISEQMRNLGIV
jgi:hypothetical protein